jgi:hypothetical protein
VKHAFRCVQGGAKTVCVYLCVFVCMCVCMFVFVCVCGHKPSWPERACAAAQSNVCGCECVRVLGVCACVHNHLGLSEDAPRQSKTVLKMLARRLKEVGSSSVNAASLAAGLKVSLLSYSRVANVLLVCC